ncbi:alpha/beta-hydrolase [Mytilinidion resinicola]|uniref:Alpha/beta-hydrolase n=1 Tax=Mytilinidion resinicola TaxID=574789 RepID=A0A6A6YJL7_9PEZI|nr:alpha/beta-hydrolase [Mytilinidion resinicola]KAF2808117.1 alpha/beta-hydrolase [Mytilinidion resinicola]
MQLHSLCFVLSALSQAQVYAASGPLGHAKNGTFLGRSVPQFKQDFFLGIPYAKPPIGEYRFRYPRSLTSKFQGVRDATKIGYTCPGKDNATLYELNEDCLNLNIVRLSNYHPTKKLPVLVQLYGGAGQTGSTNSDGNNMTFLVRRSQEMNEPVMIVFVNFRKAAFGFLASQDVAVQENIAGFGGNPDEVTIMGQFSGGDMVLWQVHAYGGGGGKSPLRAAISVSGSSNAIATNSTDWYQPLYNTLVSRLNCTSAPDQLQCLRQAPYEALNATQQDLFFFAVTDGSFLPMVGGRAKKLVKFHKVALMTGGGIDEGDSFGVPGANTEADIITRGLQQGSGYTISNKTWETIFKLYPDDPTQGIPTGTGEERFASHGYMFKRQNVISGDVVFNSNSRQDARVMSAAGMPVYKYQFATPSWTSKEFAPAAYLGAGHVTNQPFSINHPNNFTLPWCGPREARTRLREMTSSMTVAFVATLNPNKHGRDFTYWPAYNESSNGINFVFKDSGSWAEEDTFREEAIDWLIETQAGRGQ